MPPVDVPSIVSGDRIVYLDPQETIWPGDPGQCYGLSLLRGTDMLVPFSGIEDFDHTKTIYYPKTLFRFPLRVEKSGLSDNLYTPQSLNELIDELKDEAKFLLLFLRYVNTVEVYEIPWLERNKCELCFRVQIAPKDQIVLTRQRAHFKEMLEKQHMSTPFKISIPITSVQKFDVIATEKRIGLGISVQSRKTASWLVANQVGSVNEKVLEAAKKQHVFPWVGVAMELNASSECSVDKVSCSDGRVFCFLPMPVEASSALPVHVNGTFGLNDDRRTIKWPAKERKNDPTALWNKLLVTDCLPACYNLLLKTGVKDNLISSELFYHAWPVIDSLSYTPWSLLLKPLFLALFEWECLWANRCCTWVSVKHALIIPESEPVAEVVKRVLTKLKFPLCDIPDHVFAMLNKFETQVIKLSPPAVCILLRNHLHSYQSELYEDKLELLRYCLQDETCSNLGNLELLPLANKTFKTFGESVSYLCSEDFPRKLLPNLDHRLVDLWEIDKELHDKLEEVATKKPKCGAAVKLKCLSASIIANLLPQCYPPSWKDQTIVQVFYGSQDFPLEWCETFWEWVQHQNLSLFENKLIVPLVTESNCHMLKLTRLSIPSAVVLIEFDGLPSVLVEVFTKLGAHSTCLKHVPYLQHKQRFMYFNSCNPMGVLNAISHSILAIQNVRMSNVEALVLQRFLASQRFDLNSSHVHVLERLCIFRALNQNSPVSLLEASINSWKRKTVLAPSDYCFANDSLPSNIVILSHKSNSQLLLQACSSLVSMPDSMMDFLLDTLFPMIRMQHCPEDKIDPIMMQVLQYFVVLKRDRKGAIFKTELSKLNFLCVEEHSLNRKAPSELYDCSNCLLKDLFHGLPVFPNAPFNVEEMLVPLRECGLHTTVSGQKLFEIIIGYACEHSVQPQFTTIQRFSQAKAVLAYMKGNPDIADEYIHLKQHQPHPLRELLPLIPKNWLPVVSSSPHDYPKCLTWKGNSNSSHLVSVNESVLHCKVDDIAQVSSIVGSQMYIVECPGRLLQILGKQIPAEYVLEHFFHVIERQRLIGRTQLNTIVHRIYTYLNNHLDRLKPRYSTLKLRRKNLIWVKNQRKFLPPDQFVLKEHPKFQHNLAPFYQVLPESLSEYSELLVHFGVRRELINSDIVQVLKRIKDDDVMVPNLLAWEMVTSILNWLTDHGQASAKEKLASTDTLYVPIETDPTNKDRPQLANVEDVVYTDLPFLKHFVSTKEKTLFIEGKFLPLATLLGVKRLSKHWDISDDAFGDVGPHESLVSRLRTILEDYKGSLTIIKELIQNADDAGATEVNIRYDGRTHSVEPTSLIFPGMAKCHGPALLVHNNAAFKKDDFKNITKLAGATKKNKPLKVGQFGVGFCSVYHITDIPSFISGEWLYVFDPAILFLENEITNTAKPGKKLKFTEEIVHYSNQLLPYKNFFEFKQEQLYPGTIFRFPFRTHPDAQSISSVCFKKSDMQELLAAMKKAGSKLFLFLNNIKRITFDWIDTGDKEPTELFAMEKNTESIVSEHAEGRCEIQQITIMEKSLFISNEYWLTAYENHELPYSGDKSLTHKTGTASVACYLQSSLLYCPQKLEGEMFCYLPLSLQTGLPVHVSANFAVLGDRSGIHASDSDSPSEEVQWNVELCRDLIPKAYFSMLLSLHQLCCSYQDEYKFYHLWPLRYELKTHNPWEHMVNSLYHHIASSSLFYSEYSSSWLKLPESRILSSDILQTSSLTLAVNCVNRVVKELCLPVIELPPPYLEYFSGSMVHVCTIYENEFIDIFFKQIDQIPSQLRNEVLFHIFRLYAMAKKSKPYLQQHLIKEKCVPHTPDGSRLKECSKIVDPRAFFAGLYDDSDEVFPIDKFHQDNVVHLALVGLGIIQSRLPWKMIIQRVRTIPILYCMEESRFKALERTKLVFKCIEDQLMICSTPHQKSQPYVQQLTKIEFIPVVKRPKDYPKHLKWCGDIESLFPSLKLLQGNQNAQLAGSQVCIVMEDEPEEGGCGPIPCCVASALEIGQYPSCEMVVAHLLLIAEMYIHEEREEAVKIKPWIEYACQEIYNYFDQMLSQMQIFPKDLEKLNNSRCIWTGTTFISPSVIAKSWNHCGPYLYGIPYILMSKQSLVVVLKVQEEFTLDHFLAALEQIYIEYDGHPLLDSDVFKTVQEISTDLLKRITGKNFTITLSEDQVCFLPDFNKIMRKTTNLAYNDASWVKIDQDSFYVHQIIYKPVAIQLGVTSVRSKVLQRHMRLPSGGQQFSDGKPFGQHEDLTQRIRNILRDYPKDITVLKELLQNADDAKAKKMYIILDKRKHGTKKLLSPEWQDLQGPALLVWNDSGMSDMDLEGIQNLGIGSKRSNEDSIGYYGIGFNVVYHLTDCPSFLTNGNTLCVLDPHYRYIPESTHPGWQFDDIDDHFWNNFSDMKSTYLRDTDEQFDCLREVRERGTLFRLPLRHSNKLVTKSELVSKDKTSRSVGSSHKPLPAWQMEKDIQQWAPEIKKAVLFLNNVEEIKFFVIDENSKVNVTHHYKIHFTKAAANEHNQFLQKVSEYTGKSKEPTIAHYQVILSKLAPQKEQEEWLIQQGIGDIQNPNQQHNTNAKPRHGLAAKICGQAFVRKVFCFLPLPLESKLPVHVNGNFALDSARSGLWQSRDSSEPDDRQRWNLKLIEAIASSYVIFLTSQREFFLSLPKVHNAVQNYYSLFPLWLIKNKPEREMLKLAQRVFEKLSEQNSPVLCVAHISGHPNHFQWLPLINRDEPSKQAYFWKKPDKEEHAELVLPPILKKMGIQLTAAPVIIQKHFRDIKVSLPLATPEAMFEYYCSHYPCMGKEFPCSIAETKFESVTNFTKFVKYVVQETHLEEVAGTYFKFIKSPTGIPLLVTADEKLRQFSDNDKVICSKFAELFMDCCDKFVHPEMCKLNLIPNYFIEPSEDNWELISTVLKETLPECLTHNRISNISKHDISIQKLLVPLWRCFFTEKVFQVHLKEIMKEWALLLSKRNELFLCSSPDNLVPVVPSRKSTSRLNEDVFQILETSGMPVLDTEVVSPSLCKDFCPQIDQPARILQNFCNLYRSDGLQSLQNDKSFEQKVTKLFIYFGTINFAKEQESLHRIKSLPLFKNIDNTYTSLSGETYVWPSHICLSGRNVWMDGVKTSFIVFLKTDGAWSKLGPASALGIDVLSPLSVYTNFIFPYFSQMSDGDRLKHLKHVRDTPELFSAACYDSEAEVKSDRQADALSFMNALKELPCILKNGELRTVSSFCDPSIPLFKEFTDIYDYPPKDLSDKKWLQFFRNIGLKTDVSKQEFIDLCEEVASKQRRNSSKASTALLKYLFDRDQHEWHKDVGFLKEVSELPFVCTDPVKKYASILPPVRIGQKIRSDKEMVYLTSLNGAASKEIDHLIWTVMPVVQLPKLFYVSDEIPPWKFTKMKEEFYKNISICQAPHCSKVVQNLLNIANSRFTNFDLFDNYSEDLYHKGSESPLFDAIVKCFDYLSNFTCSEDLLHCLQHTACIPVSTNGNVSVIQRPVLVPPCQVIADTSEDIKELVPFLNPLPEALYSALPTVLSDIGVTKEIQYNNVWHALQVMHDHVDQLHDPNTPDILKKLLRHLYHWLCRSNSDIFSPGDEAHDIVLYLPNDHRELVDSTKLLYNDRDHYRDAHLHYKFMSLLVDELEERSVYGFCLRDLYSKLSPSVRPRALSSCCEERLSSRCRQTQLQMTEFAAKIKQALSHPDFGHIAVLIIQAQLPKASNNPQFENSLTIFHQSVSVQSIRNLEIDVLLKVGGVTNIGTAKVDFLLEHSRDYRAFSLYIDSDADGLTLGLFESLTENIVSLVAGMSHINIQEDPDFFMFAKQAIDVLLRAPSPDQLKRLLNKFGMNTAELKLYSGAARASNFSPRLGQPIPTAWYHHLHSDIHNVFRSHEWVGYEDKENHIIFARVEYHVEKFHDTQEEYESASEDEEAWISEELDSYIIMTSSDANEEEERFKTVSVVELYKILRMKQVHGSTEMVLYDPEGKEVRLWDTIKNEKLKSILNRVYQELKYISRIKDIEQRRKAIKAMCLKWHPDKCAHPFAKEAFQYIEPQIKLHLDKGLPPDDPEHRQQCESNISHPFWDREFRGYKDLVRILIEAQKFEQEELNEGRSSSINKTIESECQVNPDELKAKIWLEQAEYDMKALQVLFCSGLPKLSAHVCFMANQVAEKALRAGMYALIGLQPIDLMHHDLKSFAEKIEAKSNVAGLKEAAASLNHYLDTRYPNRYGSSHAVPSNEYELQDAIQAKKNAENLLEAIQPLIQQNH